MIDIGPLPAEIAAVNRVFADPSMARKNMAEEFWTSDHRLYSEEMHEAAKTWSRDDRQLALLASALWGYRFPEGADQFDLYCVGQLRKSHLVTVLEAIAIRAGMELSVAVPPEDPRVLAADAFEEAAEAEHAAICYARSQHDAWMKAQRQHDA